MLMVSGFTVVCWLYNLQRIKQKIIIYNTMSAVWCTQSLRFKH